MIVKVLDHAGQVRRILDFIQRHQHGLSRVQTLVAEIIQHHLIVFFLEDGAVIQALQVEEELVLHRRLVQQPAQGGGLAHAAHAGDHDHALIREGVF